MGALPDAQGQAGDRKGQISICSVPKPALTLAQRLLHSHAHPEQRLRDGGSGEGLECSHREKGDKKSKGALLQVTGESSKELSIRRTPYRKGKQSYTSSTFQLRFAK